MAGYDLELQTTLATLYSVIHHNRLQDNKYEKLKTFNVILWLNLFLEKQVESYVRKTISYIYLPVGCFKMCEVYWR